MVGAAYYVGTSADHAALLTYLGEPDSAVLHPWFITSPDMKPLSREQAMTHDKVMVVSLALGGPVGLDEAAVGRGPSDCSGVFNKLNWERLRPRGDERLTDSNQSPVLLWEPSGLDDGALGVSSIGTQADSPQAVSADYAKWVRRTSSWVARKGTKVWGLDRGATRPDLDVDLPFLNSVYALPNAARALESGASCR